MSNPPFGLPSFIVVPPAITTDLVCDGELTPPNGKWRIFFDTDLNRLTLKDSSGLKYPIGYLGDTGPSTITSLTAEANLAGVPSEELAVSWLSNSSVDSYDVEYKLRSDQEFISQSVNVNSIIIDGLSPNSIYDVRVRTIIDGVVGPYVTTSAFTLDNSFVQESTIAFVCLGDGATECAYGVVENGVEVRKILVDGTEVTLDTSRNIVDGVNLTPISQGEAIAFYNGFGTATAYDGSGNIYGMTSTADLSTELFFTRDRNNPHEVYLYSLADCVATLSTGSGVPLGSVSLTSGTVYSISFTTVDGPFKVTNNINAPLLGFIKSATTTPVDQSPIPLFGDRLIGIPSAEAWISTFSEGSVIDVSRSDNVSTSFLLSTTDYVPTGLGTGSKYVGASAIAVYTPPENLGGGGSVTSVADSDGTKSTPWLRTDALGTRGWILTSTTYLAIASESVGTVEVWNPGLDPFIDPPSATLSLTQTPGALCAKAYANSGLALTTGSFIRSTVPIYVVLEEDSSLDEYVMFTY